MPTLELKTKEGLLGCKASFFPQYKKNSKIINAEADVIAAAPIQLSSFQKALETNLSAAPAAFPVHLSPQELRSGKESEFSKNIGELRTYINEFLIAAIVGYDNRVIKPIKEMINALKPIIAEIRQTKEEPIVISFSKSELTEINSLIKMISDQVEEFDKDAERLMIEAPKTFKQQTLGNRVTAQITKKEFFENYKNFLLQAQVITSRLEAYLLNLKKEIELLDKRTAVLLQALTKAY